MMTFKGILDHIGAGALCGMVGFVLGAVVAWESGYLAGLIDQNRENFTKVKSIVESEFDESCRPWFTDVKRQSQSEVYMCYKPKFVRANQ